MLSSNNNQIYSTTSLEKSIQIHEENGNPISRFEQNQQLIDCYNYNYNYNFNPSLDEEFILLYSQKQQLLSSNNFGPEIELESANNINEEATQKASSQKKAKTDHTSTKKPISRKRSSNKDRHSKICTLRGPRDRRMRLSLEIARNFFNLQDMLGFDKASKTVEWLFAKSRNAIKELKEKYLSEVSFNNNVQIISNNNDNKSCDFGPLVRKFSAYEEVHKQKKRRKLRVVDKESRYKARARARERTRAKLILRLEKSKSDFEGNPVGVCKMDDLIEESGTKISKILELQQIHVSHGENSASLMAKQCEDKVVSKEKCSDLQAFLPGSSIDMGTVSLDNMKASPAGLKLLELDEIDRALIFYGE